MFGRLVHDPVAAVAEAEAVSELVSHPVLEPGCEPRQVQRLECRREDVYPVASRLTARSACLEAMPRSESRVYILGEVERDPVRVVVTDALDAYLEPDRCPLREPTIPRCQPDIPALAF